MEVVHAVHPRKFLYEQRAQLRSAFVQLDPGYCLLPTRYIPIMYPKLCAELINEPNSGKYVVSSAINTYYYTQIIGDAKKPPTLLASPSFTGLAVIGIPSNYIPIFVYPVI